MLSQYIEGQKSVNPRSLLQHLLWQMILPTLMYEDTYLREYPSFLFIVSTRSQD
jgi:hypothetical protein